VRRGNIAARAESLHDDAASTRQRELDDRAGGKRRGQARRPARDPRARDEGRRLRSREHRGSPLSHRCRGYYLKNPDGTEAGGERARLAFATKTDGDGRFVVSTIVPARYPQGGPPAHVHLHIPPEHPDDLTIMLDSDPSLDRERVKRMLRTWIGRVRVDGARVILEADIVAP
jgi:hypothetical protein